MKPIINKKITRKNKSIKKIIKQGKKVYLKGKKRVKSLTNILTNK